MDTFSNIKTILKIRKHVEKYNFDSKIPRHTCISNTFECINYPKVINITLSQTIKAIALTTRELIVIPVDFRTCLHKVIASFPSGSLFPRPARIRVHEMSCTCGDRKI